MMFQLANYTVSVKVYYYPSTRVYKTTAGRLKDETGNTTLNRLRPKRECGKTVKTAKFDKELIINSDSQTQIYLLRKPAPAATMKKVRFSSEDENADLEEELEVANDHNQLESTAALTENGGETAATGNKIDDRERASKSCQLLEFQLKEKCEVIRELEEQLQQLKFDEGHKKDELERNSGRVNELEAMLTDARDS